MPDPIFDEPRLAAVYDALDPDRSDLDVYVALVADELGARSVLDVGSGTGTFALMLADRGIDVVGVDPARASVEVARGKRGADRVRWLDGDATTVSDLLPDLSVDVATMTANVAQVFLSDADWVATLAGIHRALRPGGHLVFEARRPEARAWEGWTPEATRQVVDCGPAGLVEDWVEVVSYAGGVLEFASPTLFHADGVRIESTSRLRFRGREEVEASLVEAGYVVCDVRDAPDRPGREWVYVAQRPE
ncbi:class I SAM-dependent methyltransferase [Occultella glacieicola]|uniref:Class I SAM-dependent methyltransferase n=1 Tax=Occultella glacieicola TaxID=2518684 RepID=A0ABY2E9Y9_9MICO|nr:class I SAM-dependent methyltransferase [Occultella glacieicola]TDE99113.1 class I SAM-dependent methyltransferase [Occultella glacieicola]